MVTRHDITKAIKELGVQYGDIVLVHSSLKSFGYVEGGAEAVIDGITDAIGNEGTLVMPTLSQKDWEHVYETWNLNKESDVGYITEVFRKMTGTYRSDQATHSVAARGKLAREITEGHTSFGPRYGIFGDYAFSHSSPWQKMYDLHGKVIFIGITMKKNTFKHFIEYRIVDEALDSVKDVKKRNELKERIWHYNILGVKGVWPFYNAELMQEELDKLGMIAKATCGEALILCLPIHEMVDTAEKLLKEEPNRWHTQDVIVWLNEAYNR